MNTKYLIIVGVVIYLTYAVVSAFNAAAPYTKELAEYSDGIQSYKAKTKAFRHLKSVIERDPDLRDTVHTRDIGAWSLSGVARSPEALARFQAAVEEAKEIIPELENSVELLRWYTPFFVAGRIVCEDGTPLSDERITLYVVDYAEPERIRLHNETAAPDDRWNYQPTKVVSIIADDEGHFEFRNISTVEGAGVRLVVHLPMPNSTTVDVIVNDPAVTVTIPESPDADKNGPCPARAAAAQPRRSLAAMNLCEVAP